MCAINSHAGRQRGLLGRDHWGEDKVGSMEIRRLERQYAEGTIALLDELQVSLFGVQSHPLHVALARDAIAGTIDARLALEGGS